MIIYCATQIFFAFVFGKFLNRIAQHRAWHRFIVLFEEFFFGLLISFSYFPQHPADCFVDKVVLVVDEDICDS